jgi:hypothetical protein
MEAMIMSICHKCNAREGKSYTFYIGTKTNTGKIKEYKRVYMSQTTYYDNVPIYFYRYTLTGSQSMFLCDDCIKDYLETDAKKNDAPMLFGCGSIFLAGGICLAIFLQIPIWIKLLIGGLVLCLSVISFYGGWQYAHKKGRKFVTVTEAAGEEYAISLYGEEHGLNDYKPIIYNGITTNAGTTQLYTTFEKNEVFKTSDSFEA